MRHLFYKTGVKNSQKGRNVQIFSHHASSNWTHGSDNPSARNHARKYWTILLTHGQIYWTAWLAEFAYYTRTCLARRKQLVSRKNSHGHVTWIRVHYWLHPWIRFIITYDILWHTYKIWSSDEWLEKYLAFRGRNGHDSKWTKIFYVLWKTTISASLRFSESRFCFKHFMRTHFKYKSTF